MVQINYTQKRSIIDSGKAIRVAINPHNKGEFFETIFLWIPKSAIIKITGWYIFVEDWFFDASKDMQELQKITKCLPILVFGNTIRDFE